MTATDPAARARRALLEGAATLERTAHDDALLAALVAIARALADAIANGGKVLLCGNGGSAADAQHVATELVVRLTKARERRALPALALTTDTSLLTACANDYSFDQVFARQVEALGRPGDVLIGISTSGGSRNVIEAFRAAEALGVRRVLFGGCGGGALAGQADLAFVVPSHETSHIQEAHLAAYHALCALVEDFLFGELP